MKYIDRARLDGERVVRQMEALKTLKRWGPTAARAIGQSIVQSLSLLAALVSVRGSGVRRRRMRVVESLALGGRRQLLLVMCDEQEYLVGAGAEGVATIVPRQSGAGMQTGVAEAVKTQGGTGAGTALREKTQRRATQRSAWQVTPGGRAIPENRICEDLIGKRREQWQ
jgi:hypothetical protein